MERQELGRIAHRDHPVAAPLSDASVHRLLERQLRRCPNSSALDLGCGEAAWLVRALTMHPNLQAIGVDTDPAALDDGRRAAERAGVEGRLALHHADVREFEAADSFDAVLSVGATYAFGGLLPTLEAVRPLLAPGGTLLLGESYWEDGRPTDHAREFFGDDLTDLSGVLATLRAAGWWPIAGHTSTREELDTYEWSWTGSLTDWALDQPPGPDRDQALAAATRHRHQWLNEYRDGFGFVTLLLRPAVSA
ncbi:SAM-dependent methyltransferase [Kitasatospora sp. NPDC048407]|uniref:SAM-dependent methyltransferase n=1 Tax=Kitasatospora sp. NPDC048407 TaxID=3364051 RepID=UPI003722E4F8